ncbi:MAG TPA: DUF1302 domain-containing protein [Limnobacter sp.]|uniref:DUF1302 domain-containing protein n=1 Tax=Limnobacter sp. TaxID=2003368 RepID=UPI002EDA1357
MSKLASFSRSRTSASVRSMIAVGLLTAAALPAHAENYQLGDYDLTVNSTVSVGSSWRVEGRDPRLIGANNGMGGRGASTTTDDGNLNYDAGDRFSTVIKGIHEFELKKADDYGFFTRVKWFYDDALNNRAVAKGHAPNGYIPNTELNDSGFNPYSRFDGIDLLDAYGYKNTDINGMPLSVRLGRQVIGWGESTLIFSPLSGINTLDLSALRRPGVDLKEAFTPSEHLYFNLGLNDTTSLEAFYQLKWRKTVTEGCGTIFASNDIAGDGCNFVSVGPDSNAALTGGVGVFRTLDVQPKNDGQFGVALRKYSTDLGAEFGAYYTQYHSRLPIISAVKQTTASPFSAKYLLEYPEDIGVFGLSFATNVGSWAWSGEVTYSKDVPLQLNTADLLLSVLNAGYGSASYFGQRYNAAAAGQKVSGYDTFDVTQIQSSVIKQFDRVLGASRYLFLAEVGATFVSGLPEAKGVAGAGGIAGARYGRSPVFGTANGSLSAPDAVSSGGFVTDFAWGYRARLTGEYRDAIGSIDLFPQISWAHDVDGWSPEPGQAFNEGRQALGLGLGFEFDANTKASINYVKFVNSAAYDVFRDRDFISLSASYSF